MFLKYFVLKISIFNLLSQVSSRDSLPFGKMKVFFTITLSVMYALPKQTWPRVTYPKDNLYVEAEITSFYSCKEVRCVDILHKLYLTAVWSLPDHNTWNKFSCGRGNSCVRPVVFDETLGSTSTCALICEEGTHICCLPQIKVWK